MRSGESKERAAEGPGETHLIMQQSQPAKGVIQALQISGTNNVAVLKAGKESVGTHGSLKEGVWRDKEGITHSVAVRTVKMAGSNKCLAITHKDMEILARLPRYSNVVRVIGVRPGQEPVIVEE
ncbi:unnamed protein product [Ostreobium quekettii]|uniref:Uncharacterized protein n=1 Tax=Ostreobium quekettii TaxID=121088 RepID=A0A8S1J5B2_9CHLO|nr:unnamed protein product [Ostreobium quekettii]